jgi:HSP20 family protein
MSDKTKANEKIAAAVMEDFIKTNEAVSPLLYLVNICEKDRKYQLTMAAPGFKKGDFKVTTQGNTLMVSAEVNHHHSDTGKTYTRRDFVRSSFGRAFCLPENVITDHVSSRYHHGMLIINLKKNDRFLHGKTHVKTDN